MKRLCFVLPDVPTTEKIVDELKEQGVEERQMYALAKEGVPIEDLPESTILEKSDFIRGAEIGAVGGGIIGAIAGLVAVSFPPAGLVLGGGAVVATTLAGASLSALLSGLIGLDFPNARLEKYHDAIESGHILMVVDVSEDRAAEIESAAKAHHPEAEVEEAEPHVLQ